VGKYIITHIHIIYRTIYTPVATPMKSGASQLGFILYYYYHYQYHSHYTTNTGTNTNTLLLLLLLVYYYHHYSDYRLM